MQQTRTQALFGAHFARRLWRFGTVPPLVAAPGYVLGQIRPYLPIATLRAAVSYPVPEPTWVFLDDATAALDEETERRAYAVLTERLPDATVVSIAHRPAVAQYHTRRWTLVPQGEGRSELQAA